MLRVAHRLLLLLIVFAIVGGTTAQLAQSGQYAPPMTMADMPCDTMMPTADAEHSKPLAPCKGVTPDCIKVMDCVTVVALPARFVSHEFTAHFTTVEYWSGSPAMAELVHTPELLPPRTI